MPFHISSLYKMKNRLVAVPAWIIVLLILVFAGCKDNPTAVEVEVRPPNFTLKDSDGNDFTLSSTQGNVVLLNFFATWCSSCRLEIEHLVELHEEYKDSGLVIIGITMEAEGAEEVADFKEEYEIPYQLLVDDGVVGGFGYKVTRVPTNYLIDKDVFLYGPYPGMTKEELAELIAPFL